VPTPPTCSSLGTLVTSPTTCREPPPATKTQAAVTAPQPIPQLRPPNVHTHHYAHPTDIKPNSTLMHRNSKSFREPLMALHHSITPSLHHSITPSLHHSITPSLHHSIQKEKIIPHPEIATLTPFARNDSNLLFIAHIPQTGTLTH
jgi:hypothetical protein